MNTTSVLIRRNMKLYFKDKGMFFTSLITPMILLVLYITFLGNVYRDSFLLSFPEGVQILPDLVDGLVAGQLMSSLLAVSCVTVAFCSNFLMVQDKANGNIRDLRITPVKPAVLSLSYYVASLACTLIVCLSATVMCLVYVGIAGWYLSVTDVLLVAADVVLLSFFGTALSSVINYFLSTQGQISAVGSIVSSCYGFICGAYMPISSFGEGLQKAVLFLPGTYGTSLLRTHCLQGVFSQLQAQGIPAAVVKDLADSVDCNLYFFGTQVSPGVMYLILGGTVAALVALYVFINRTKKAK